VFSSENFGTLTDEVESELLVSARAVVDKYRAIATCLSLFGDEYNVVGDTWNMQKRRAIDFLSVTKPKPSAAFIHSFFEEVRSDELVQYDMRIRDAIGYCKKNEQLIKNFYSFEFPDFKASFQDVLDSRKGK
jgi:hypothetical protein